jgi:hypothetical protein
MDVRSTIGAELAFARKYDTAIANPARVACDLHRHFSNVPDQRPRATDARRETPAELRGSLNSVGWAKLSIRLALGEIRLVGELRLHKTIPNDWSGNRSKHAVAVAELIQVNAVFGADGG